MVHGANQPPPPLKKRLRSILTMIVSKKTKAVVSWLVNFKVRVFKISA